MNPEIPKWGLNQLNIMDIGHTIQISGVIYSDDEVVYLCMMPDEPMLLRQVRVLELDQEAWKKIIRQSDLMETEILAKASDGKLAKVIVRKSTRQIEQGISWAVFRRDNFKCRYCGADDRPLTVDHLVTWEEGGPSIEENLVACCRKCNKTRGDKPYEVWLRSDYYTKEIALLRGPHLTKLNQDLVPTLADIPRREHTRGR
jgi:hypothetical protein